MRRSAVAGSSAGVAVLAMLLLRGSFTGAAPAKDSNSQDTSNTQAAATAGVLADWSVDGPWRASRTHFSGLFPNTPDGECPSLSSAKQEKKVAELNDVTLTMRADGKTRTVVNPRSEVWCIPDNERVHAMIAIVPDPVHTHMALHFDRAVEALQLGAEAVGYVMDRYWLPWRPDLGSRNPLSATEGKTSEKELQPGLLLFRWNGDLRTPPDDLLYVFLVSDTSTAGVNGSQFTNAVNYIHAVCADANSPQGSCNTHSDIQIMGPTFSGSLYSLRRLTTAQPKVHFNAVSGTVSSGTAQKHQHFRHPGDAMASSPCPDGDPCNLVFQTLVHDTEPAITNFLETLKQNGSIDCENEVAILSEAATTYGSITRNPNGEQPQASDSCQHAEYAFPREISSLRNAYENVARQQSTQGSSPNAVSEQNYLPFKLSDRQPNDSDEAPDFALQLGPLAKEAVLMDFAAEMRRRHFRYIGINASNVLDVLFLANFLRSACPDVRLFMLNADLLFERSQDNVPYIGMVSVSTYPLVGRNLQWTKPTGNPDLPHQPFADQYEEGLYNAVVTVVQETVPPDKQLARYYELQPSFGGLSETHIPERLPLWMTTVGTGGYWPVQLIWPQHDAQKSGDLAGKATLRKDDFSPAWITITIILVALAFTHLLVLYIATPVSARFHDFAVLWAACEQRMFFINVGSATLALSLVVVLSPALRFGRWASSYVILLEVLATAAIFLLLCCCVLLQRRCPGASLPATGKIRWPVVWQLLIWIVALVCGALWLRLMVERPDLYGFFFAYRSVHLATGVSPLTPLLPLFAAIYLWCIFEIWRLRFADLVRPRLQNGSAIPGSEREKGIARSVSHYFLEPSYLLSFLLLFFVWLLFLHPLHPFEVFEHTAFVALYEILLCLAVALMLSGGFRLGQTWSELRKLLRDLERSPVRHVFAGMEDAGWSPIWQSGGQEHEWTSLARSFEVMTQAKITGSQVEASSRLFNRRLQGAIAQAEVAREAVRSAYMLAAPGAGATRDEDVLDRKLHHNFLLFNRVASALKALVSALAPDKESAYRELLLKFSVVQKRLAAVLDAAVKTLQEHWNSHPVQADEHGKQEEQVVVYCGKEQKSDPTERQVRVLEQFVALRYVAFIRGVLGHVRHLIIFLALSFSLVLISLNVYSFEPHQSLIWSFTAIFAVVGITVIGVLIEAHRDPVISRITGTQPDKLELQFFLRVATLGAVPLITLLATHFPAIGRYLLGLLQPGVEALK